MVSNYLFALAMGLVGVILTYLDSLQTKLPVSKTTYIKVFMATSIISLITSEFFKAGSSIPRTIATPAIGSDISRQQILTGNPDF